MTGQIACGDIHHLRLTVTDINRSREFYTSLLGFDVAVESPPDDGFGPADIHTAPITRCVMIPGILDVAVESPPDDDPSAAAARIICRTDSGVRILTPSRSPRPVAPGRDRFDE